MSAVFFVQVERKGNEEEPSQEEKERLEKVLLTTNFLVGWTFTPVFLVGWA